LPAFYNYKPSARRGYLFDDVSPLFAFGYGLSYTTFKYANLRTSANQLHANGAIDVSFTVENTGKRAGDEVVQMYVKYLRSTIRRPQKELKGFKRITVNAGQRKNITLTLKAEQLGYWNVAEHRFVVEPGEVQVLIGSSSAEAKLTKTIQVMKSVP